MIRKAEPVAIIGLSCRFPGGADDPRKFWRLLSRSGDAITEVPPTRWNLRKFYSVDREAPGRTYSRWAGWIDRIEDFDAAFFGISPREARRMDPQQRLLLELAYEAFEDAGTVADELAGSDTGVFVGLSSADFFAFRTGILERQSIDAYTNAGSSASIASNRVSYVFDLRGPSIVVDTACSSGLVALHLAFRSLQEGECGLALAGAANILLRPESTIGFSKASMLSSTGRCKTFDARADGYVRSEGGGFVLLKTLTRAVADGDAIYAVIRGTAVNQDGRTPGLSVPNRFAQEAVVLAAHDCGGTSPSQVQYVEAHGTGTPVGDPIEAEALSSVLCTDRSVDDPCLIGSVKTNIGHLEPASGIAGLIKVALILRHGEVPANLHFETPNPEIDFAKLKLRVPISPERLPRTDGRPCLAGINSFGFGGTNAHAVIEEFHPGAEQARDDRHVELPCVVPLSARTPEALKARAASVGSWLREPDIAAESIEDIARCAAVGRAHLSQRLAVVASSTEELAESLSQFVDGQGSTAVVTRPAAAGVPRLMFVFTGMGPQWWGMGRELLEQEPVFRAVIERCDQVLSRFASWSLLEEMTRGAEVSRMNETEVVQPANFALQVALAELFHSWGIEPFAVVGHSVGEVAAAYNAGVLDLVDAMRIAFHRGRLLQRMTGHGKLLAVSLGMNELSPLLDQYDGAISVAAVNSPADVTLAGPVGELRALAEEMERRGVFSRMLRVEVPYHSHLLEPLASEFRESIAGVSPRTATVPLLSTVAKNWVEGPELDPDYWWRNMRNAVLFEGAITRFLHESCKQHNPIFLEIGPHPVLEPSILECLARAGLRGGVVATLRRNVPERASLARMLADLYALQFSIEWKNLYGDRDRKSSLRMPPYAWQRERHWEESSASVEDRLGDSVVSPVSNGREVHPLLGRRLDTAGVGWITELSQDGRLAYLQDHRVQGMAILPAAAYAEIALAAGRQMFGDAGILLKDLVFERALFVESQRSIHLNSSFDADRVSFNIFASAENASVEDSADGSTIAWIRHSRCEIHRLDGLANRRLSFAEMRGELTRRVEVPELYQALNGAGFDYGEEFRTVRELWEGHGRALGRITLAQRLADQLDDYQIHPALLDGCLQVGMGVALDGRSGENRYLPVGIDSFRFYRRAPRDVWCHVQARPNRDLDFCLVDGDGRVVAEIEGLRLQRTDQRKKEDYLFEYEWGHASDTADSLSTRYLPEPAVLAEDVKERFAKLAERWDTRKLYRTVLPDLDVLCEEYVAEALSRLGGDSAAIEVAAPGAARRLVRRLVEHLAARGRTVGANGLAASAYKGAALGHWQTLLFRHPGAQAELRLIKRCGEHLPDVVRGLIDPAELLFGGGTSVGTEHLYSDALTSRLSNWLLRSAVIGAVGRLPLGCRCRILEIGSATPGITVQLLSLLPPSAVSYTVAVRSSAAMERVAKQIHHSDVSHALLDIELDPEHQGFVPHSYDIVIADNALHATADLQASLSHVKSLLAPQGLLILLELNRAPLWVEMVWGMLDRWWRFADHDLRPASPVLGMNRWRTLLQSEGFASVASLCDADDPEEALQSVLIARAPVALAVPSATLRRTETSGEWLIFADRGGAGERLEAALRKRGDRATLVLAGKEYRVDGQHLYIRPNEPEDLLRFMSERELRVQNLRGIVHLWGLDMRSTEETTPEGFIAEQWIGCESVMTLLQALSGEERVDPIALWIVTRGAQFPVVGPTRSSLAQSPLWGFGRVVMNEVSSVRCKLVDLSGEDDAREIERLVDEMFGESHEDEIALRGSNRFVRRLVKAGKEARSPHDSKLSAMAVGDGALTESFRLELAVPGILESLTWRVAQRRPPGADEVEIEVVAAGLNFKDVVLATDLVSGLQSDDPNSAAGLGLECAGRVVAVGPDVTRYRVGDEIVGYVPGSFARFVTTSQWNLERKPRHLDFEEAATIPVAFSTAYLCLRELARLQRREAVLIHAATGGVGLAAVQIARLIGAEVFATAGSDDKRALLRDLGVTHVMDSRTPAFANEVMEVTRGRGIDVILNSLSGEAVDRNLSILAPYGRLVEIGKRDMFSDRKLSLRDFRRSLSYMTFDLSHITHDRPIDCNRVLAELLALFEQGKLKPLPFCVFPITAAAHAYRYMARARHVGKIVLSFREPAVPVTLGPECRIGLRHDATYLVSGGTTGLGLVAARWLAERGGGRIVLLSRNGIRSEIDRAAVEKLRDLGSEPVVVLGDVTKEDCLRAIRVDSERLGRPLRGVIHAAMVLDDALIENLTPERIAAVMAPKVSGAWLLHTMTKDLPLDLFVLFSSFASIIGSPGQASYAAANAFIDSLAHYRKACGLPALTISFGAVADVGYLSTHAQVQQVLRQQGIRAMRSSELLAMLDALLVASPCQVVAADPDWATIAASFPAARSPRFGQVTKGATSERDQLGKAKEVGVLDADLAEVLLREEIAKVLGARPATIDAEQPLIDSGLDSLMAVELRNQIRERSGVDVPILILMKDASLKSLVEYVAERRPPGIPDRSRSGQNDLDSRPSLDALRQDEPGRPLRHEELGGFQDATQLLNQLEELSEQELDAALIAIESRHAREESQE